MERYNLYLTDALTGGAKSETDTFSYDLKQVLPLSMKDKKFILYSSFCSLDTWGGDQLSAVEVAIDLTTNAYSSTTTYDSFLTLGVATPVQNFFDTSYDYSYTFNEASCFPVMIDYPTNQYEIKVRFTNKENNFTSGSSYGLHLSFMPVRE